MMRSALAAGIGPEDFWRLSLKEWRWLAARGAGLKAGRLTELMAGFPDEAEGEARTASSFDFAQDESGLEKRSC
tara:strand:+ start:634747 stop:634968 length:222 start_codon:yes stop_codon:yes gene_type:complete